MNDSKVNNPITVVWEVTMGCNMRCKHCGSSCQQPLPDELNTDEALETADQMASDLGVKWVTLSGGEPLTRRDLRLIISHLTSKGVTVNVITNGWLLHYYASILKNAGVSTVAVSIDGPKELHDEIRMPGSYERSQAGIKDLKELGVTVGVITTITKTNIGCLKELKEALIDMGVDSWQLQIGLPMGNLGEHPDWVIEPSQVDDIIDFCYETMKEGKIRIYPADCIGYYNNKELEVRRVSFQSENVAWDGCNAGIRSFGLLHDGTMVGCTSIRSKEYYEGNVRERPLVDIWRDKNCFNWRRTLKKEELSGVCGQCAYGSKCLGGCPNTRLTMEGSIYGENKYCSYNNYYRNLERKFAQKINQEELLAEAKEALAADEYQKAALASARVLQISSNHLEALKLKGYAEYMCGNYQLSVDANKRALEINPDEPYALKGLALSGYKVGMQSNEVMALLYRADNVTFHSDRDLLHDIEVMKKALGL